MAKRVTVLDVITGRTASGKAPKQATLIPWSKGPGTSRVKRFIRDAIG